MTNIKVVIGANLGDEGKGLMTDYFASQVKGKGIVVRFNGGAQAGHTVCTPEGKRHIFGHHGSGSFLKLPTFLSSFFIINPMFQRVEFGKLQDMNVDPRLYISDESIVTTPYDMMMNQIVESIRSKSKHGSCGLGINETVHRNETSEFKMNVHYLENLDNVRKMATDIRDIYVPRRLAELGYLQSDVPKFYQDLLESEVMIDNYIKDCEWFIDHNIIMTDDRLKEFDTVIFEGAQGLMLDQNYKDFPYVTRSNTGMQNVASIIKSAGIQDCPVEISYGTRTYLTRHGVGPFPTELPEKPYKGIEDLTNITNPYQDHLRFGHIDIDELLWRIKSDMRYAKGLNYTLQVAVSCLDQLDEEKLKCFVDGKEIEIPPSQFLRKIINGLMIDGCYVSYGPTRNSIGRYSYNGGIQ